MLSDGHLAPACLSVGGLCTRVTQITPAPALALEQNHLPFPPPCTAQHPIAIHSRRLGVRPLPSSSKPGSSTSPATLCQGTGREGSNTDNSGGPPPGQEGREKLPIPALAAALSQASARSGASRAATYAPCPASLLQIPHGPSVSGSRAAQRLVWALAGTKGNGLLTASIFPSANGERDASSPPDLNEGHSSDTPRT